MDPDNHFYNNLCQELTRLNKQFLIGQAVHSIIAGESPILDGLSEEEIDRVLDVVNNIRKDHSQI